MHVHGADTELFERAVERVRQDIERAVQAWRSQGRGDDELALVVNAVPLGTPIVSTSTRLQLAQTITDFEPTMAIEFSRHIPGQAPAVVELRDYVRRVLWIDLPPR